MSKPERRVRPATVGLADDPARIFAAMGDRTRLALLQRLSDGHRHSITRLAAETSLTRQAVTKHLQVLEDAGLVESARTGRESRFGLQPDTIREAQDYLQAVSVQWDRALGRLAAFLEDEI